MTTCVRWQDWQGQGLEQGAFLPLRAEQRYTCLRQGRRYLYEGLFRGFSAELELDEAGLVLDYPDTFRRVAMPG